MEREMKRALVIEDNPDNMELITFILESYGFETLRAWKGEEGCAAAAGQQPDFIILDIQLPDIEGTEVVRRLQADPAVCHIPVIAMTSYAMAGDREKLLAGGCTGYIEKPIDPERVISQITGILEGSGCGF